MHRQSKLERLERTALKEWAVLVDAMIRGDFCAMIRKGGIREQRAGFAVRHDRFLLYPTFFHENLDELEPAIRDRLNESHAAKPPAGQLILTHAALVKAQWHVTDLDSLKSIDGQHGLAWKAVESRFHYKNKPGVHVIAVELVELPRAIEVAEAKRYLGCVSWVELDESVDLSDARPVHDYHRTEQQLARLRDALGDPVLSEAH